MEGHIARVHEGSKNLVCQECNKGFKTDMDLKIHQKVHSGATKECPICKKVLSETSLSGHMN